MYNDGRLSPTKPVGTEYSLLDCDIFQIDRETDQSRKPNRQQQMPVPHSRTLETERHTYQIPSKLRAMVVTDQNGGECQNRHFCFDRAWPETSIYPFYSGEEAYTQESRFKGNIPRISSYTWLFAKNTG